MTYAEWVLAVVGLLGIVWLGLKLVRWRRRRFYERHFRAGYDHGLRKSLGDGIAEGKFSAAYARQLYAKLMYKKFGATEETYRPDVQARGRDPGRVANRAVRYVVEWPHGHPDR